VATNSKNISVKTCNPVIFHLHEEPPERISRHLDEAAANEAAQGRNVRAFLLTNPNNPCGTM
jgi:bifunctional pyridoxal-dependent enzyme with beta-cystathionase and maltose regulon repressor activities